MMDAAVPEVTSADGRHRVFFHSAERMDEVEDGSVALCVTSPPYGLDAPYGSHAGQLERRITSFDEYHAFRRSLETIWEKVARKVMPGGYVVINTLDPMCHSRVFGRNCFIPHVAYTTLYWTETLGWDLKAPRTWSAVRGKHNTAGQTVSVMGSYLLPLEGSMSRQLESVLTFRKPVSKTKWAREGYDPELRRASKMTKEEWFDDFDQLWTFGGARKEKTGLEVEHPAPFPAELPRRAIAMYSIREDIVLDPFCGTGTTLAEAKRLGRRSVGYEINPSFRPLIEAKLLPYTAGVTAPRVQSKLHSGASTLTEGD